MAAETSLLGRYFYQHLNTLNTSMQGPRENILTSTDKLFTFKNKMKVWKKNTSQMKNTEMFLLLLQIQSQTDKETISLIISHLELLTENLNKYMLSSNQFTQSARRTKTD
jgi:hypothetical protein